MRRLSKFYQEERERGITLSAMLHLCVLIAVAFGLPSFMDSKPPEPVIITVEVLPVTGITNVKPMEAEKPKEEPKPEAKPTPPVEQEAKPTPPITTAEATPTPPTPVEEKKEEVPLPKPEEKKPEEKKPEEKKPEEKKKAEKEKEKKKKEDDLAAILKAVKDTAKKQQKDEKAEKKKKEMADNGDQKLDKATKNNSQTYDPTLPMSLSERDAIMSQIARNWNVPAGAKDAHELIVVVNVELREDGEVLKVELANSSKPRYSQDTFFRAAADSAIRAVKLSSPLKNLPPDKYATWREMELTFNPREMLF